MTCRIIYRVRYLSPKSGDFNSIREFLGKMAMNPADRPKVQVNAGGGAPTPNQPDDPKQIDTFAEIAKEVSQQTRVQ
jgi:diaminopimelate decarboxylase